MEEMLIVRRKLFQWRILHDTLTITRLPMAPCMTRTHALCVVNDGLLVFGGCLPSNGDDPYVAHGISADANFLAFRDLQWRVLHTAGQRPSPRFLSAATVSDGKFIVSGGCMQPSRPLGNTFSLDLGSLIWHEHQLPSDGSIGHDLVSFDQVIAVCSQHSISLCYLESKVVTSITRPASHDPARIYFNFAVGARFLLSITSSSFRNSAILIDVETADVVSLESFPSRDGTPIIAVLPNYPCYVLVYGRPVDVDDHLAYTPDVVAFDASVISLRESAPFRRRDNGKSSGSFAKPSKPTLNDVARTFIAQRGREFRLHSSMEAFALNGALQTFNVDGAGIIAVTAKGDLLLFD